MFMDVHGHDAWPVKAAISMPWQMTVPTLLHHKPSNSRPFVNLVNYAVYTAVRLFLLFLSLC